MQRKHLAEEEKGKGLSGIMSFVFLQLSLTCRLITCSLILIHVLGLISTEENQMPIFFMRIFYYLSIVFFYVSCSLNIYEWLLIIHRVNFFGGIISLNDYQFRARANRVIFEFIATGVGLVNVALIFAQAIDPNQPTCLALTMTILIVFSVMLIILTVVGSILIRRLELFFKKNYDKQRFSLLTALLLLIASLVTLALRYAVEYAYQVRKFNVNITPGNQTSKSYHY